MLVSHFMITYSFVFGKLIGSSTLLRTHGKGGARATTLFLSAPPSEKSAGGFQQAGKKEGGWGESILAPPAIPGSGTGVGAAPLSCSVKRGKAKHFSIPFRRRVARQN